MIFSSSKKFIFFAVPKTGTHAVREVLRPLLGSDDWEQQMLTGRMLSPVPEIANIGHGHISYRQLTDAVGQDLVASCFSFAIVRHPIDRFMSVCAFLARTDPNYTDDPVAWAKRAFGFERFRQRVLVRPQSDLLTDDKGELALSFIGRYEQLGDDLGQICDELGAPRVQLRRRNVTSNEKPKIHSDNGFLRELEAFYSDDFSLLGYDRS
ncbi:MAG: sulfotransferase family 2 domain-containing protein [Luminiphilus sp.]